MKSIIFALLFCSIAQADEFHFVYILNRDKLEYKTQAPTWKEAFERGSQFCFDFFVEREKILTEDKGLDIIDTCANPM